MPEMRLELNYLKEVDGSINLELEKLEAPSITNYKIYLDNTNPYEYVIEKFYFEDDGGYAKVEKVPESVKGNTTGVIDLTITIPKNPTIPFSGRCFLKGYFLIR